MQGRPDPHLGRLLARRVDRSVRTHLVDGAQPPATEAADVVRVDRAQCRVDLVGRVGALAAFMIGRGLVDEGWATARGAAKVTYERGLWFRTPEAYDADGDFRASIYLRPLAIWAIEEALRAPPGRRGSTVTDTEAAVAPRLAPRTGTSAISGRTPPRPWRERGRTTDGEPQQPRDVGTDADRDHLRSTESSAMTPRPIRMATARPEPTMVRMIPDMKRTATDGSTGSL